MAFHHSPKIVTTDLVMCLDSANSKSYPGSGSTWYDLSGNGNNGTLTNGAVIQNGLLSLDGIGETDGDPTGAYVSVSEPATKSNNYADGCTWNWWMYMRGVQSGGQRIFHYSSTINHVEIRSEGANAVLRIEPALHNNYPPLGSTSIDGGAYISTWYNFTIVFDNEASPRTIKFYKNGELFHTLDNFDDGTYTTTEYCSFNAIGRAGGTVDYAYSSSFYGYIPIVQVYGNKLSAAQVKQNYDALKGRFGL